MKFPKACTDLYSIKQENDIVIIENTVMFQEKSIKETIVTPIEYKIFTKYALIHMSTIRKDLTVVVV